MPILVLLAAALATHPPPWAARDRRIVDSVMVGDARSEAAHGYVGIDARADTTDGATYREAQGWMRYALTTFDDTEVTVSCTFAASTAQRAVDRTADLRRFDLVVEDSLVATQEFVPAAEPRTVNILVPLVLTRGKTNIAIVLRARGGATPALRELRTVQDHNEHTPLSYSLGATR